MKNDKIIQKKKIKQSESHLFTSLTDGLGYFFLAKLKGTTCDFFRNCGE